MKRLVLLLITGIFLVGLINSVLAVDVAYIVTNEPEPGFIDALDDLELSYEVIFHSSITPGYDFSGYKMILVNNDYFVYWNRIPINNKPALVAGSSHVDEWGWSNRATLQSDSDGIYVDVNTSSEIGSGIPSNFKVYTKNKPDVYLLDKIDVYDGFEIAASSVRDSKDIVVGLVREGTILKKSGKPDTAVNANSVFFGMFDSEFWTSETEQLFKNALLWLYEPDTYELELDDGINLVSIPITLRDKSVANLLAENLDIISVKEYDVLSESIIDASTIERNKGYFIETSSDLNLILEGTITTAEQNVDLISGMNLIGISKSSSITLNSLPSKIKEVSRRKADGSYETAVRYLFGWHNPYNIQLEPGKGYWFKLNGNTIWSYSV